MRAVRAARATWRPSEEATASAEARACRSEGHDVQSKAKQRMGGRIPERAEVSVKSGQCQLLKIATKRGRKRTSEAGEGGKAGKAQHQRRENTCAICESEVKVRRSSQLQHCADGCKVQRTYAKAGGQQVAKMRECFFCVFVCRRISRLPEFESAHGEWAGLRWAQSEEGEESEERGSRVGGSHGTERARHAQRTVLRGALGSLGSLRSGAGETPVRVFLFFMKVFTFLQFL